MSAASPQPSMIDEALEGNDLEVRRRRLVPIGLCGSVVSLLIALLTGTMFWRTTVGWWYGVLIAVVVGSFIGLAHAPILGWTIARKRPLFAVPLVYLGAVLICCLVMQLQDPAWAIVAFTFAVPLLALLAMLLPNQRLGRRDQCYSCGYDLSGHQSDACPECGAPILIPIKPFGDSEGAA